VKSLLDMGISPHLIAELRADDHEAFHIGELSSGRLADAAIGARRRPSCATATERGWQRGFTNFLIGLFGSIRNPRAFKTRR
jgi:hypothetical protein